MQKAKPLQLDVLAILTKWVLLNCCFPENAVASVVLLLTASSQLADHNFPVSKEKAASPIFHCKSGTSCALALGPMQSSPCQPPSERVSEGHAIMSLCITHFTWHENVWLEKTYRSHSPLLIIPWSSPKTLCVCKWEVTWTGMKQGGHIETGWSQPVGCCRLHQRQGVLRSTSRTAWDLCLPQAHGSAGLPGVAQVHTRIYIHKMHTRRNRCFATHTYITPLIASRGLCQKTSPIL